MLGNLADGEIEFYKSVCNLITFLCRVFGTDVGIQGNGGMGQDHTCNTKNTSGCLNLRDRSYGTLQVYNLIIRLYRMPYQFSSRRQETMIRP